MLIKADICCSLGSLTGRGENCYFAAVFIPRVHPHDDAAPDWTHQQPLPKVPDKHGYRLFFCCSGQLRPERQGKAEKGGAVKKDAN